MFRLAHEDRRARSATYHTNGVDLCVVNALRRVIHSEVETVAVDFVIDDTHHRFLAQPVNNTAMSTEFICHRIALAPLHFSQAEIEDPATVRDMSVSVDAANDEPNTTRIITTADARILRGNATVSDDEAARLFPVDPYTGDHVTLVHLVTKQSPKRVAFHLPLVKGCGRQHARFSPVSVCHFVDMMDEPALDAAWKKAGGSKVMSRVQFEREQGHDFVKMNKRGDPDAFVFTLESVCGLSCGDIVRQAVRLLADRVETAADRITDVEEAGEPEAGALLTVVIAGATHTEGNLIQSFLYDRHVPSRLRYVGYNAPHPLEDVVHLKMSLVRSETEASAPFDARAFLKAECATIADDIRKVEVVDPAATTSSHHVREK
jgi:DNA-directed RNA polymerase subunit L